MELRHLRHVVAIARYQSFTKAAEELGISQPVLSRSIQAIERHENVRLFDRDRSGVRLTAVGRDFVDRASVLLRDAEDLKSVLQRSASGLGGELAFGLGPLPARALLASVLAQPEFSAADLRLFVAVRNGEGLLPLLMANRIEFFVCAESAFPDSTSLRCSLLGHLSVSALVRPGHPLLRGAAAAGPFTVAVSGAGGAPLYIPDFLRPHVDPYRRVVIEENEVIAELTSRTDQIWVTSPFSARAQIADGRLVELRPPDDAVRLRIRIMMYTLERRSLSPAAMKMKAALRAEMQRLETWSPAVAPALDPAGA